MKTIFVFLIFTLAVFVSNAQVDSVSSNEMLYDSVRQVVTEMQEEGVEHFAFKDIPINGSLGQFVAHLKELGFTVVKINSEDAILKGRFTGEDVDVLVQATPKIVYGVTVVYNEKSSWKAIKAQYENMKFMLTAKYGEPIETIEKFDDTYYENSGLELLALRQDKYTYMTHFVTETANGLIRLSISSNASLVINYVDALNYLLVSDEVYNDL